MDEISGFWSGARRYRGTLAELARAAGGWPALIGGGPSLWRSLGVEPDVADAWGAAPPEPTIGQAITLDDPRYPPLLREIPGAPPVLCVEGPADVLARPMIAVVGTRNCTAYGAGVTRHLAQGLARAGFVVVSGLARGIDAHAHAASLADTVAVLAHGLPFTAPPMNRGLRRSIVANGGAMVSALPDADEPRPYTFPTRNRWIAGMAAATVVVEAPLKSGALHTSTAAAELGRDVYAVPGHLGAASQRGCLELIRDGAEIVCDVDELVASLAGRKNPPKQAEWQLALFGGASVEEAARVANRSTAELLAELGRMELEGRVRRLPGHRYAPGPAGS